jgi:hypothetical protein
MTAVSDTPTNPNFLSPINFKFSLKRAPTVNFFIQKVNIPGLSLPSVDMPTPIIAIPYPGDHLSYDELEISFRVDEDLLNYLELHNWLRGLGRLNPSDYYTLQQNPTYGGDGLRSDISLNILRSTRQPNFEIIFKDAFPISLSSINFDSTMEDVNFIEATCSFRYLNFDIVKSG